MGCSGCCAGLSGTWTGFATTFAAELRRLLNSLVQACARPTLTASGPGQAGADDASTRPASATAGDAAARSHDGS